MQRSNIFELKKVNNPSFFFQMLHQTVVRFMTNKNEKIKT